MQVAEVKTNSTARNNIQAKRQPFFSKEGQDSFFSKSSEASTSFFSPTTIQPKLTIGEPNDKYEVEADAMADKVVQRLSMGHAKRSRSMAQSNGVAQSTIQTKCSTCEEEEKLQKKEDDFSQSVLDVQRKPIFESNAERPDADIQSKPLTTSIVQTKCSSCEQEEKLQKKEEEELPDSEISLQRKASDIPSENSPDFESRLCSSKGSGSSLPSNIQSSMGSEFGADFSSVRVHTGSEAIQMSQDIGAQAFTHGSDIYFNQGKYDTNSTSGKHLLAHELTHTVQQGESVQTKNKSDENKNLGKSETPNIQRAWYNFNIPGTDLQFDPSIRGVKYAANIAANVAGDSVDWIVDQIRSAINVGTTYLNDKWESIQDFGRTCFDDIKNGFGNLAHFVTTPLSILMSVLSEMNADPLGAVWNSVKTGANALWLGINSVINGVLQTGERIWNAVPVFINGIFNTISGLFDNRVFNLLPDWLKTELRSNFNDLRSLWTRVSAFWTNLWQRLTRNVQEILAAVRSFFDNIISYSIGKVISMVRNLKEMYIYMTKLFADPQATIQPFLSQIAIKLNAEVPERANRVGNKFAQENYPGGSSQKSLNGSIQKYSSGSTEERTTASLEEVGEGILYYISQAWAKLDIKKMLWDTAVNTFWPPATIKAIFSQFSQLWNDDWATTVESLYTPRNFLSDPIGSLHDVWSNFLILLDFPLALWRTLNNVVGLLMGYISIIIILAETIIGAAAGGGVGAIPGFLAGLATVAVIGETLMVSFVAAESISVIAILLRLYTARQTCIKRQVDILTSVASFITMAVALVLQLLMALLAGLVTLIANFLKGISRGVPVPQPVPRPQPQPVPRPQPQPVPRPQPQTVPRPQPATPGGGNVIPFPHQPAPVAPLPPGQIAAKFEEGGSQDLSKENLLEENKSSSALTNKSNENQAYNHNPESRPLLSVSIAANGRIQTARKDEIDPEKCRDDNECENIYVPGFAPQDNISRDHARRNGGVSGSLAQEVTKTREISGFKELSDYYGNNIAGFMYGVYENENTNTPIDTGTIVRRNDSVHSEERIIADLLEIRQNYPLNNVIRVDQIATERSACSTCYDLIRRSRILTQNKIYTQRSGIYFITRYTANRNTNAKELRARYCRIIGSGP